MTPNLMASSATRGVRWRIKVKAHVLALICPSTAPSLIRGCGSTSAPSWQRASGGRPAALHVTDDTGRHLRYTSRAKREADVALSHRCTMEHPVAPWSTTMRRVLPPRDKRVKASPHRHKWMLSHGAPADPSDPWNSHAAPVSPRQNGVFPGCSMVQRCDSETSASRFARDVAGDVRCRP